MRFFFYLMILSCTSARELPSTDGTKNFLITCSSLGKCYEKAAEKCQGQFSPVETEIKEVPGYNGTTAEEIRLVAKCG